MTAARPARRRGFRSRHAYKAALGVPVVGGALMVAVLVVTTCHRCCRRGCAPCWARLLTSLFQAPVALAAFVLALSVVAAGGSVLLFLVRAGTLAVTVQGERQASDELHAGSLRFDLLRRAHACQLERLGGVQHFGPSLRDARRVVARGLYRVRRTLRAQHGGRVPGHAHRAGTRPFPSRCLWRRADWSIAITLINLLYLILQIIVVSADCTLGAAATRLCCFSVARRATGGRHLCRHHDGVWCSARPRHCS